MSICYVGPAFPGWNHTSTDLTLILPDGPFQTHSLILKYNSPYFASLLDRWSSDESIKIVDHPRILRFLLSLFYQPLDRDEIHPTWKLPAEINKIDVLQLIDYYQFRYFSWNGSLVPSYDHLQWYHRYVVLKTVTIEKDTPNLLISFLVNGNNHDYEDHQLQFLADHFPQAKCKSFEKYRAECRRFQELKEYLEDPRDFFHRLSLWRLNTRAWIWAGTDREKKEALLAWLLNEFPQYYVEEDPGGVRAKSETVRDYTRIYLDRDHHGPRYEFYNRGILFRDDYQPPNRNDPLPKEVLIS